MKLKNILFQACALAGGTIILSSCNDFLDREPLSSVTPEVYFSTTDHFEAYSIAKYNNWFSSHAGYGMGIGNGDGGTDNAVSGGYNSHCMKKEHGKFLNQVGDGLSMISVIVIISLKTQFLNTKPARFRVVLPT